jgi:hypothetical protein
MSAVWLVASRAHAQSAQEPWSQARVHIGPLALSPAISLTNAGIDTNVFNEPSDAGPKRDFTMTVQPKTDVWLRVGRSLVSGNATEDLVYYDKYANQRSANSSYKVGLLVPLTRLSFNGAVSYLRTKERPGFEIDARSQRSEVAYEGGVELRALSNTFIGLKARRQIVDFAEDAVFLQKNLQVELNRTVIGQGLTLRHQLTPLTSVVFEVIRQQDRFKFSNLRDSDSTQITAGFRFDPFALLKGSATFGYRDFEPLQPDLPAYKGSTAAVDLSYVALGSTKLSVQAGRDVQYSYDINQPYYVQTGINASLAQQIFGPVDVVGRIGAQRLDYRDRVGAIVAASNRTDDVRTYGGGVGYHLGKDLRIGFNVDNVHRSSPVSSREYEGLRYGTAVTYGF